MKVAPVIVELFIIYQHPAAYPDSWVVFRQVVSPEGQYITEQTPLIVAPTLHQARTVIPPNWFNIGRDPDGDPTIFEVWI